MSDEDLNAPSWLSADPAVDKPAAKTAKPDAAEKPAKGGMFKMFSKEAVTEKAGKAVAKAAVDHVTTTAAKNIASSPDDGFTPAWATQKAYTAPENDNTTVGNTDIESNNKKESAPTPLDIEPETLKRIKFYHIVVRVLYMIAAIIMAAAAGLSLVAQTNIGSAFFAIYVLFFCLLICCFEVGLNMISRFIATNFGFMYTLSGRVIFLLFVGFMSFSLSIFGIAAMAFMYLVGLVHAVVMCRFPQYSEYVRQKDFFGSKAENK